MPDAGIDVDALRRELEREVEGEVRFDTISRALYATDASVYQITPAGVVLVKSREDVGRVVRICREYRCPLTMRGGGTSQAGQAIGSGVDRRYLEVLQPPPGGEYRRAMGTRRAWHRARRVERDAPAGRPSLCAGHLDGQPRHARRDDGQQLRRRPLGALWQDHRSRARAARGPVGRQLRCIFGPLDAASSTSVCQRTSLEGPVIARCGGRPASALRRSSGDTQRCFDGSAATTSMRSSTRTRPSTWRSLMVGSEGTLGVVVEARIALVPLPKFKAVMVDPVR